MVNIEKMTPKEAISSFYKQLMKIKKKVIEEDPYSYMYIGDLEQEMNWWLAHN